MLFKPLSQQEIGQKEFTHMAVVTANDLTQATANTAQSFNVAALPVGSVIEKVVLRLITPFKDPADAAFNSDTVDVGDTGSATRYLTAQEVNENGTEITAPQYNATLGGPFAASQFLTIRFNSMAAKSLVNIKIGELHVFVKLSDYKPLSDAQPSTSLTK